MVRILRKFCWREGNTLTPLLLGDGSLRWWWPQLVLEVGSPIHLVENIPTPCIVVGGVLAPPPLLPLLLARPSMLLNIIFKTLAS